MAKYKKENMIHIPVIFIFNLNATVKPALSDHSKRRPKLVFKTDYRLMHVKSIAEIILQYFLQYFRPSLSYIRTICHYFVLFIFERPFEAT